MNQPVGLSDTSGRSVDQGWRGQGWVELRCPRCGRTAYGPEGNTFCGWHAPDQVLLEPVLTAKGPDLCQTSTEEARLERHDKLHEAIRYTERERDTALSEKVALEGIVEGLVRAITEHRTAIHNAGTIKVQPGYEQVAEAKHRADNRLWSVLDA